jgi:hypothetical protein
MGNKDISVLTVGLDSDCDGENIGTELEDSEPGLILFDAMFENRR